MNSIGRPQVPLMVRILRRITYDCGCWLYTGKLDADGYGRLGGQRVHRAVYESCVGPLGAMQTDHMCRNRACANPIHLEPVTSKVNTLRGVSPAAFHALATHCKHGHEFTTVNTYVTNGRGVRQCIKCGSERKKAKTRLSRAGRQN